MPADNDHVHKLDGINLDATSLTTSSTTSRTTSVSTVTRHAARDHHRDRHAARYHHRDRDVHHDDDRFAVVARERGGQIGG